MATRVIAIIAHLVLFLRFVHAYPLNSSHPLITRATGQPGAVYVCTDRNFKENCIYLKWQRGCVDLANDQYKSFGPDLKSTCFLYEKTHCEQPKYNRPDRPPPIYDNHGKPDRTPLEVWKYPGSYIDKAVTIRSYECLNHD
jgi:hypothetical protein